jgi:hypothetical protein
MIALRQRYADACHKGVLFDEVESESLQATGPMAVTRTGGDSHNAMCRTRFPRFAISSVPSSPAAFNVDHAADRGRGERDTVQRVFTDPMEGIP